MQSKGFTLIELMITLAVATILLAVGIPSFRDTILRNSVSSSRDELFNSLVYARSEAIKRGQAITVCQSISQTGCASGDAWASGWIVFADDDRDGVRDSGEELLRAYGPRPSEILVSSSAGRITFFSQGQANAALNLTMRHDSDAKYDRALRVTASGRTRKGA